MWLPAHGRREAHELFIRRYDSLDGAEKHREHVRVARLGGEVDHGLVPDGPRVPVRAAREQPRRDAAVAPLHRGVQRRRPAPPRAIDHLRRRLRRRGRISVVSPQRVEQRVERREVAVLRRDVERGVPRLVLRPLLGASAAQKRDARRPPLPRRHVQRRVAPARVPPVDLRAVVLDAVAKVEVWHEGVPNHRA